MSFFSNILLAVNANAAETLDNLIKRIVNTSDTPLNTSINDANTALSSIQASIASLQSTVNNISAIVARGGHKGTQRGRSSFAPTSGSTMAISITRVDPDKCFVILDGAAMGGGTFRTTVNYAEASPYKYSLTSTTLTIGMNANSEDNNYNGGGGFRTFSWEIVESY
jgi:hypothetical protein